MVLTSGKTVWQEATDHSDQIATKEGFSKALWEVR